MSNLVRATLLIVIVALVVYLFTNDGTILNQGEVNVPVTRNALNNRAHSSSNGVGVNVNQLSANANAQAQAYANKVNANANANAQRSANYPKQVSIKRTVNPQVDDDLNALPMYEGETRNVRFGLSQNEDENEFKRLNFNANSLSNSNDDLNTVNLNRSVLPFPQFSNNYTPLNGHVSQYRSDGAQNSSPQEVDIFPTRCGPGLSCYPRDTVTAAELLPREDPYNQWSQVNPDTPGHLADKNFLESGYHHGINTVGSSLRNANQQLRADPPIPQVPVSIWNTSTIEPDTNRRGFDIGTSC